MRDFTSSRPFIASDLIAVDARSSFVGRETLLENYGSLFTFLREGHPVACAGIVTLWPGVGEAWTVISEWARRHPIWLVSVLRHGLRDQIAERSFHRVQMHVEDDPKLLKWGRVLGFHQESTMKKYTSEGQTLHLLALLP
jgi:hypothetical protein